MPPLLWADFPFQYLVPLVFFVIWVLNQIFGQGTTSAPAPRRDLSTPPGPGPGRPSRGPMAPPPRSEPTMTWADRAPREPQRRPASPSSRGDQILVIGPDRPAAKPSARQGRGGTRKASKPRPSAEPRPETGESDTRPTLTAEMSSSAPDISQAVQSKEAAVLELLRGALGDREKVRQAILVSEILQPPVARRLQRAFGRSPSLTGLVRVPGPIVHGAAPEVLAPGAQEPSGDAKL